MKITEYTTEELLKMLVEKAIQLDREDLIFLLGYSTRTVVSIDKIKGWYSVGTLYQPKWY